MSFEKQYANVFIVEKHVTDDMEIHVSVAGFVSYNKETINFAIEEFQNYLTLMGLDNESYSEEEFGEYMNTYYPESYKYHKEKSKDLTGLDMRLRYSNSSDGKLYNVHTDEELDCEELQMVIDSKQKEGKLKEFLEQAKVKTAR